MPLKSKLIQIFQPEGKISLAHNLLYYCVIYIDLCFPDFRYYRSGVEMIRLANMNMQDGSYENAYILYIKFTT